jgi:MEDS: MEthanogen/methylotroph, DcmR Sensory domain
VASPANQPALRLKSEGRGRADEGLLAGFPLRLVPAQAAKKEEDLALGVGAARLRVGEPAALLSWTADERLRGLVAVVIEGLRAGDRIVCVVNDLALPAIERALAAAGVDAPAWAAEGRLALVPAADALFLGGVFDPLAALAELHALVTERESVCESASAGRRTRLFVDMTYLLADVPGIERGLELEARVGDALRGLPVVRICAFDAGREVSDRLADVLRMHPTVISEGGSLRNPYYRPWSELRAVRRAAPLARLATREAK